MRMSKKWTMLLLVGMMTFTGVTTGELPKAKAAAEEDSQQVKLMTFNIRNRSGTGDIAWVNRKQRVVNAIESYGPDVIGMQEGYENQIHDLLNGLSASYASVGVSRYGNTTDEYNNILYRSDKYQAAEWGQFWLSDTPDVPGSKSTHETSYPRICTWAKFQSLDDSRAQFYYFNTHLGLTDEARAQGVGLLLNRIAKYVTSPTIPVFLGGDLNMEETSPSFQQLQNSDLNDTWADLGHSYTNDGTYSNFDGSVDTGHIDWIFQRNSTRLQSIEINRYNENGLYPSDHYPVQLTVNIPLTGDPSPDRTSFGTATSQYSDSPAGEEAAKAFDNDKRTKYYTPHGSAWVQFRFANGSRFAINRYRLTSGNDNPQLRDPKNWTVKGSNDGVNWTVLDGQSNQNFELRYQTREYAFSNTAGYEYIRFEFTSGGGSGLQVSEIELFDYVNTARNVSATADGFVYGEGPEKAIDGTVAGNSKWAATGAEPHYLQLDLGVRHNITRFVVKHSAAGGEAAELNTAAFRIQVSEDGTNWNSMVNVTDNKANVTTHNVNVFGRYARLYITDAAARSGDTAARIYEFEVYGLKEGAVFYQHGSYGGYAVSLPKGRYSLDQLIEAGIRNDDITSLRIVGGVSVKLYWNDNFQGDSLTLTSDQTTLSPYGWNDKASSIVIE
ncbi:discoidin domain-containing protein [Paenibacillus sp. FSL R7-0048]|uniref:discoidin domain-containing protein n=1 Tax=Paenibacillus TaxID=44249 RepID=UPI00096E26FB|nr:discoidin domain-containing protein [Paenibacillus odorifer]OMD64121.1 hypothetical protein BSK48_25330 [Paenibacillus odorifer]